MSDKKDMPKEVGVIGQMYEDRKTKRRGVLESRDEKYKTLMFRDEKGGSFSIVYSTFRSNWRKCNGDAPVIKTSTQKEEEKKVEAEKQAKAEKKAKAAEKEPTVSHADMLKAFADTYDTVEGMLSKSKAEGVTLKRTTKGATVLHLKKMTLAEVWTTPKKGIFSVCTNLSLDVSDKVTHTHMSEWRQKEKYESATLHELLKPLIKSVEQYLKDKKDLKEKKEDK